MNHSSWRGLPALVLLFGALLVAGNAQARLKHAHSGEVVEGREAVANEIIVRFKNPSAAAHAALSRDEDMDESALIGNGRHTVFHSRTRSAAQLLQRLRARADVAYAMPNHLVRLSLVPNEPPIQYNSLWGLRVTGTPLAWDLTTGTTTPSSI